jgi:hypothetical protein
MHRKRISLWALAMAIICCASSACGTLETEEIDTEE